MLGHCWRLQAVLPFDCAAYLGDFLDSALRAIEAQLATDKGNLSRSADLIEQSARAMLADLDEWRLINQQHDLSVG